ncbi:MAG: type II toxin-antitoxin system ParD family antitoxin [Crocinitomicaceae bacterium]|nr:type II toxin-antitoxin system ParD family antitoxin [Crocinitomicaceae bacterium]
MNTSELQSEKISLINWITRLKDEAIKLGKTVSHKDAYQEFKKMEVMKDREIRTALKFFEQEDAKTKLLIHELQVGEKSAKIRNFDRQKNLEKLKENFQK